MIDWGDEVKPRAAHKGISGIDKILKYARIGDIESVKLSVSNRPELLHGFSRGHNRSLAWEAIRGNRLEVLEYLIESGAELNIPGRIRSEIQVLLQPICIGIRYRRNELVVLLRSCGITEDFYTKCFLGDLGEVKKAVKENPELINNEVEFDTVWRVTALHYAVAGQNLNVVEYILSQGAEVHAYSRLLLNICARQKSGEMYNLLLESGINESYIEKWYQHQV